MVESEQKPKTYLESGVNIALADKFVESIKALSSLAGAPGADSLKKGAGGYAAVYEPPGGGQLVAITTDGVGSKLLLCEEFNSYDTIGIDLVAMCANDLICVGAKPALFLDYFACGALDIERGKSIIKGIVDGCGQAAMLLVGGETAEMPDLYAKNHFDLAGFAVGFAESAGLLSGDNVAPGQIVVGVASTGVHSNGFSLARKLISSQSPLRRELLTPTAIYVKPATAALAQLGKKITGMAHITGGGFTNLLRLSPSVGFSLESPLPHGLIFGHFAESIAPQELYTTFNMGMGLAVVVKDKEAADSLIRIFADAGHTAQIVGSVTADTGEVRIASSLSNTVITLTNN